ncbi:alpha-helical coiled-coil protein [Staphylococcus aureus]|nr:alpha-helical coiled-coil protein [Staphylococcus aureus]
MTLFLLEANNLDFASTKEELEAHHHYLRRQFQH